MVSGFYFQQKIKSDTFDGTFEEFFNYFLEGRGKWIIWWNMRFAIIKQSHLVNLFFLSQLLFDYFFYNLQYKMRNAHAENIEIFIFGWKPDGSLTHKTRLF